MSNVSARTYLDTPIGILELCASDDELLSILFVDEYHQAMSGNAITEQAKHQLSEYFSGQRQSFSLPMHRRGTDFQHKVWQSLATIPFGETRSYGQIATVIKAPKAVRAVGAANGKNLFTIILPCHRVIGANGSLTGYAGGVSRKQWLLAHEQHVLAQE